MEKKKIGALRRLAGAFALVSLMASAPAAWAKPVVSSELQVHQVVHERNGDVLKPVTVVKPGDVLEYRAVYGNSGDSGAAHFMASVPVPSGTSLLAAGTVPAGAQATVDGTHYAPMPLMHAVIGKDGKSHQVPVPLAEIRGLRWDLGTLGPHETKDVRLRVHVDTPNAAIEGAKTPATAGSGS